MNKTYRAVLLVLGGVVSVQASANTIPTGGNETQPDLAVNDVTLVDQAQAGPVDSGPVVEVTELTASDSFESTLIDACTPNRTDPIVPDFCSEFTLGATTSFDAALAAMSPDQLGSMTKYSNTINASQRKSINSRLNKRRSESGSRESSATSVQVSGGGASADALIGQGFAVFGTLQYNDGDRDRTTREEGYDWSASSLSFGGDYRVKNNLIVGAMMGVSDNDTSYTSSRGEMEAESTSLAAYGSYYSDQGYLDWMVTYGDYDYTVSRHVLFLAVDVRTNGATKGDQWGVNISGGKDFFVKDKTISPYFGLAYADTSIDSYIETGGGSYNYVVNGQANVSSVSNLGVRFSQAKSYVWGVLLPSAHIEWLHEFRNDSRTINSSFAVDPSLAFDVATDTPDRSYFNAGASVSATMPGGRSAFASISSVLGQEYVSNVVLSLGGRVEF